MSFLVPLTFAFTYAGMAFGRIPGLRVDRTGIAVIALAILLASGAVDIVGVGRAIDGPTLVLLFALMIVSAQFELSGFYDACVARIVGAGTGPIGLLALTVVVAGVLSAVLANDIVVFTMTPLLCAGIARRGLNPKPYLLVLAGAANAGSAATVIGNPQNILIGQVGHLDFLSFLAVCGVPALVALAVVFAVVVTVYRHDLVIDAPETAAQTPAVVDRWQVTKALIATGVLICLFVTPIPREVAAIAVAGVLLASRSLASRRMLGAVDWHLLVLFLCLFTVTAVFGDSQVAQAGLAWLGAHDLAPDHLAMLAPLALVLSNGIGNVPAVVLIVAFWPDLDAGALYALALLSTLAGNLFLVGSVANLIVAERAAASGQRLGFADFARTGVPITALSLGFAVVWLLAWGVTPW